MSRNYRVAHCCNVYMELMIIIFYIARLSSHDIYKMMLACLVFLNRIINT